MAKTCVCSACGAIVESRRIMRGEVIRDATWSVCRRCGAVSSVPNGLPVGTDPEHLRHAEHGAPAKLERYTQSKQPLYSAVVAGVAQREPPPATLLDVGSSFGG